MYRGIQERTFGPQPHAGLAGRGWSAPAVPRAGGRGLVSAAVGMELEYAQFSHEGRVREQNEDYASRYAPESPEQARSRGWLFALADGVGGQASGEVAARAAVEALVEGFRKAPGSELHTSLLHRLFQAANARVLELSHTPGAGSPGMATTLVACALRYNQLTVAHAGDSRCYLARRGKTRQLTRDHTVANEHARLGVISGDEIAESATRHVLSRALGSELAVAADTSQHEVQAGDFLLLCSDGLHASVKEQDIAEIASAPGDLESAARKLVALANERDGSDNITALVVKIRGVERVGMYRGRPYRLP